MKGSGVVQSLKSLVSKLHPQMPLSPKESQRLLTALTSSFRKQLDEAHPRQAQDEDVRPKLDRLDPLNPGYHGRQTSSVSFADKHLATVLTNPLLAKVAADEKPDAYEEAKLDLEQNPDKDPILVLEEYQQLGAATIPLADLCLRTFQASVVDLSKDERQQKIAEAKAGLRSLRWLWGSGLYAPDNFVQNRRFMGALVSMLIEEGEEQLLWDWLCIDLRHRYWPTKWEKRPTRAYVSPFRWKDFIVRLLIMKNFDNNSPESMNKVLDTYFKAVDLHLELERDFPNNHLPLIGSSNSINTRIFNARHDKKAWDIERYDRYMKTQPLIDPDSLWAEQKVALLWLTHPSHPSAIPLYNCLKVSSLAAPGSHQASVWTSFIKGREGHPQETRIRDKSYSKLVETARLLQIQGHREEAEWLVSETRKHFPEHEQRLDIELKQGTSRPTVARPAVHPPAVPKNAIKESDLWHPLYNPS